MGKLFKEIASGLKDAIDIGKGKTSPETYRVHVPDDVDVKAIRKRSGLTQEAFAYRYGFNLARVRDWEQKRSKPDSAARAYLIVIDKKPKAVDAALKEVA